MLSDTMMFTCLELTVRRIAKQLVFCFSNMILYGVFLNNPCLPLQPNCYSRAITILGDEHIIIFAKRDIDPWEELTYDYRSGVGYDFAFDLLNIIDLYKILSMLSSGFFQVINDFHVIVDSPSAVE